MAAFIALLRAVNVGGTGKLPMTELKSMCETLGFAGVRTYIASGNVVFSSRKSEAAVKKALEAALESYAGRPISSSIWRGKMFTPRMMPGAPSRRMAKSVPGLRRRRVSQPS